MGTPNREGKAAGPGHVSERVPAVASWGSLLLGSTGTSRGHLADIVPPRREEVGFYPQPPCHWLRVATRA